MIISEQGAEEILIWFFIRPCSKYERSKQLMENLKKSEENLLADKRQSAEQTALQEQRYEKLKSHAMQQMDM